MHGRGEPQLAEPLGSVVEFPGRPTVAMLRDKNEVWPDSNAQYNYIGYDISRTGHPVIKYSVGKAQIKEFHAADDAGNKLSRTITVVSPEAEMWCKIAEGTTITKLPNGLYAVNDKQYFIQLADKSEPVIRKMSGNTTELLLPIRGKDNNASIKYSIIW